jgi:hypothetical protein
MDDAAESLLPLLEVVVLPVLFVSVLVVVLVVPFAIADSMAVAVGTVRL